MNRDKEFEDILEECLERMLTHGDSVEQCLKLHPEYAARLEPLLKTAASVNRAVDVKPSAEFKARAAYQMRVAMGDRTPSKYHRPWWQWHPRWALAAGVAVSVLVLGTSAVFASTASLPGNPLYAVKLVTENVRIQLAGSDIQKAGLYARYADKRMSEMNQLVEAGKIRNIDSVAERFDVTVTNMSNLSLDGAEEFTMLAAQAPGPVAADTAGQKGLLTAPSATTVTDATSQPTDAIPGVASAPPPVVLVTPSAAPAWETAANPENSREDSRSEAYGTGATQSSSVAPNKNSSDDEQHERDKEKLKKEISSYAVNHPEMLRRMLGSDKVPESTKLAIRRALWAAENGYKKALDQLGH